MSTFDPDDAYYADRPEWADVTPISQYEGVNPIAPIFYSEECGSPLPDHCLLSCFL